MSDVNICHLTLKFSEYCTFTNVKVRENRWEGCVSVTYEYYLGAERVLQYMCCDDVTGILPPPPTSALFPLFLCPHLEEGRWWRPCSSLFHRFLSASLPLRATHTPTRSHTHTVRLAHTVFPPGLAGRTALLIQRGEGQLGRVHL